MNFIRITYSITVYNVDKRIFPQLVETEIWLVELSLMLKIEKTGETHSWLLKKKSVIIIYE